MQQFNLARLTLTATVTVLGLTGVLTSGANAQTSAIRGAYLEQRPNGSVAAIAGEVVVPDTLFFIDVVVTPTVTDPGENSASIDDLTVESGSDIEVVSETTGTSSSLEAVIASEIADAESVEDQATLIRAAVSGPTFVEFFGLE